MSFFEELKRRNVVKMAALYVVGSWFILQVADVLFDALELPSTWLRLILAILILGLPLTLIFAWVYEMTPEGLKREKDIDRIQSATQATGRKMNVLIAVLLVLAIATVVADRLVPGAATTADPKQLATETQAPVRSVAVLPFVAMSSGTDDEYFADGLTEEILNALAQLSELAVTARTSSFYFKGKNVPIGEIADTLGVSHIVEGSLRRDGDKVRITAQLIRAEDGFHMWSDTYNRATLGGFDVQTEIAEAVALSLDVYLDDDQLAAMRAAGVGDPQAFIAYQKGVEHYEIAHGLEAKEDSFTKANEFFEQAFLLAPGFLDARKLYTDKLTHELLDYVVSGRPVDENFGAVHSSLLRELDAVVEFAHDPGRRLSAEYDRALLSGSWGRLSDLTSRMIAVGGCSLPVWPNTIAIPYGSAADAAERFRLRRICDPLRHEGWYWEIEARNWISQPKEAMELALTGLESVPHERLRIALFEAYIVMGNATEAKLVIDHGPFRDDIEQERRIMLAASQGNREKAEELILSHPTEYRRSGGVQYNAWIGNREEANRTAAEYDSNPFGHLALATTILGCMCGMPFDLAATPNFAKRIEASGLQWPPHSPITWPLKDW